jgi:class 3 adenylate cyclase
LGAPVFPFFTFNELQSYPSVDLELIFSVNKATTKLDISSGELGPRESTTFGGIMGDGDLDDLIEKALVAFRSVIQQPGDSKNGYMIFSDLCGSTEVISGNLQKGAALQAAHETVCATLSNNALDSPRFKSLGDGVMIEFSSARAACRIALQLIELSKALRSMAEKGEQRSEFKEFTLKVVVASGEFLPVGETQRWLGILPTKAARLASYARPDQVWIDSGVAEAISPHLQFLGATYDDKPIKGASFEVPFKGFKGRRFTIHELRSLNQQTTLTQDEKEKELLLTWQDIMFGLKQLVQKINNDGYVPKRVIGIGRSGAILGGIIAGNLPSEEGHIPVDVCERTQPSVGAERIISSLTEPPETYVGPEFKIETRNPTPAWDKGPVLLVIGEAKTNSSFHSVESWLRRRGINEIRTLAFVKGREARPHYYWEDAQNALLPWQFTSGYDQNWPTYR